MTIPADSRSWVDVEHDSHFPLQNLPFGRIAGPSAVSRIGDWLVDLTELATSGLLPWSPSGDYREDLRRHGPDALRQLRLALAELFEASNPRLRDDAALRERVLLSAEQSRLILPIRPPAFVDFYSGIQHASNVGRMFRPDQPPLLPNYRWLPVGYNGRASTVVVSGTEIVRPRGQTKAPNDPEPTFGPTKELDFELEMGYFLNRDTSLGETVSVADAEELVLGLVIVNDWSARDVQRWEYQPLGPFLAKSFATSISPWIVLPDALEAFRIEGTPQDPPALPHLRPSKPGHFDIALEVGVKTQAMSRPQIVCRSNTKHLYWSIAQQIAHQASNGTALEIGDLYASGTISGEGEDSYGSLLELTWRGERDVILEETGEPLSFLQDGDEVSMSAYAQGPGYRIGFGDVVGRILPSP